MVKVNSTNESLLRKIQKPRTRRGKRIIEKREPQLIEDCKRAMLCRSSTANQRGIQILKDFHSLKKPNSIYLNRKEQWQPFIDAQSLEFVATKNDCALFAYVNHSKKRPNNLILGRLFDNTLLDMCEFEFKNFISLSEFHKPKITMGTKPIILFSGQMFETIPDYQRIKSLLLDFFVGPNVEQINLTGLEHCLHFIEVDGEILMRSYRIMMKKSGQRLPRIELDEIGPRIDFTVRRKQFASDDVFKKSLKQPDSVLRQQQLQENPRKEKQKNISIDPFGTKLGRIHMEQQDYNRLQLRKGGAFKVAKISN